MNRSDVEALLKLDEEQKARQTYNRLQYMYPEKDITDYAVSTLCPQGIVYSRDKYHKHMDFFAAGKEYKERLFTAGNRVGKSFSGLYELCVHLTGLYPDWWPGKRYTRPVKVWVGGKNLKTIRDSVQTVLFGEKSDIGSGLLPKHLIHKTRAALNVADGIETADITHVSGGLSTFSVKTYESGLEGFVGAAVDIVMLDEEPPLNLYIESLMRTATTKGMVYVTFTPDKGFSDTVKSFFAATGFKDGQVGHKWVTVCGWDDIPHLEDEEKRKLWESIPSYLRDAKTKGIPYLGSGAIYQFLKQDISVRPFDIPAKWPRAFGLDVGWTHPTAAVWGAYDQQNDVLYIYGEYKQSQREVTTHAHAIKSRGAWIPGVIDKASMGSNQIDGRCVFDIYKNHDLEIYPSRRSKTLNAGIALVTERLATGRLKVFTTCTEWFAEIAMYHTDDKGKITEENDDLMDATRYLVEGFQDIMLIDPDFSKPKRNIQSSQGRDKWSGY
jgi:phage terminase large subunit-like protein